MRILFKTEQLTLKENANGVQYVEGRCKDSVAVFLTRNKNEVLLHRQPLPVTYERYQHLALFHCPIMGGVEEHEDPMHAALRLVDAYGYRLCIELPWLTSYIVSEKSSETCHVYTADVTDIPPESPLQDGLEWNPLSSLQHCNYAACQLGFYLLCERNGK